MSIILSYIEKISFIPTEYTLSIAQTISAILFVGLLYGLARLISLFCNNMVMKIVERFQSDRWLHAMKNKHVFSALGMVTSALVALNTYNAFVTPEMPLFAQMMHKIVGMFCLFSFTWFITTFLNALDKLYGRNPNLPIRGLIQATKIVIFLATGLFFLSLVLGRRPMYIVTGLSALAAVFSLIFKDPILGFAAGIQLTTNNLIKIGDWITVESAGADGNIIDIGLTSVRVQNFDMTIVSIPTYDLISKPFKNWNGMFNAKARRIQRSLVIDVDTIRFLDKSMLTRLQKIDLLKDYLKNKESELEQFNESHNVKDHILNGRHLSNIGTFRKYAELYIASRPYVISDDPGFTLMVRQLPQTAQGLPLEIYCFLNTTVWVDYEHLQSDIFDHLFSVMPEFGLFAYQQPSGHNIAQGILELQQTKK